MSLRERLERERDDLRQQLNSVQEGQAKMRSDFLGSNERLAKEVEKREAEIDTLEEEKREAISKQDALKGEISKAREEYEEKLRLKE